MAVKLGLKQLGGEGGAIDDHQLGCRAAGEVMERVGDDLFAGSRFSLDQHGGTGGGDLLDQLGDPLDLRGSPDQARQAAAFFHLPDELDVLNLQGTGALGPLEQHLHLIQIQRLGDKMKSATPHCLHGRVYRAVGGHHQDHRRGGELRGRIDQIHSRIAAQAQVRQQQLDRLAP